MEIDLGLVLLALLSLVIALFISWKFRIDEDVKLMKLYIFNIHKSVKKPGLYFAYGFWILAVVFMFLRIPLT